MSRIGLLSFFSACRQAAAAAAGQRRSKHSRERRGAHAMRGAREAAAMGSSWCWLLMQLRCEGCCMLGALHPCWRKACAACRRPPAAASLSAPVQGRPSGRPAAPLSRRRLTSELPTVQLPASRARRPATPRKPPSMAAAGAAASPPGCRQLDMVHRGSIPAMQQRRADARAEAASGMLGAANAPPSRPSLAPLHQTPGKRPGEARPSNLGMASRVPGTAQGARRGRTFRHRRLVACTAQIVALGGKEALATPLAAQEPLVFAAALARTLPPTARAWAGPWGTCTSLLPVS